MTGWWSGDIRLSILTTQHGKATTLWYWAFAIQYDVSKFSNCTHGRKLLRVIQVHDPACTSDNRFDVVSRGADGDMTIARAGDITHSTRSR
jgi:hypothetical protein